MNPIPLPWLPWLDALGWTLLHSLWQGAVIGAMYAILRAGTCREDSTTRYWLALGALATLLASTVMTAFALRPVHANALLPRSDRLDDTAPWMQSSDAGLDAALPWLAGFWSLGVMALLLRALAHACLLARIVRGAAADPRTDRLMASLRDRFRVAGAIMARVSDRIDTPMLIGWWRPVIVLPVAIALGFPRAQLECVLAHELGHFHRRDHWFNVFQIFVETLLFHHPVVHWIARHAREERELCCDRLVIDTIDAPIDYARALAAIEESRQSQNLALAASGGRLLDRIRRIVEPSTVPNATLSPSAVHGLWLSLLVAVTVFAATRSDAGIRTDGPRLPSARIDMVPTLRDLADIHVPARRVGNLERASSRIDLAPRRAAETTSASRPAPIRSVDPLVIDPVPAERLTIDARDVEVDSINRRRFRLAMVRPTSACTIRTGSHICRESGNDANVRVFRPAR